MGNNFAVLIKLISSYKNQICKFIILSLHEFVKEILSKKLILSLLFILKISGYLVRILTLFLLKTNVLIILVESFFSIKS